MKMRSSSVCSSPGERKRPTCPSPARATRSSPRRRSRGFSRRGSRTCPTRPRSRRPRNFSVTSRALPASSRARRRSTRTFAPWPRRRRAFEGGDDREVGGRPRDRPRDRRRRKEPLAPRRAEGRHGRPRRSAEDRRGRDGADREREPAVLHAARRPALGRDGQSRDAHGARVPARRVGRPERPRDPRERRRPHQPRGRARRPRPRGGLVLPCPQGPDGLRPAAAALAALLGRLRPPRQQPRRHSEEARPDARHAGRLPRVASRRRARPARVDSAPDRSGRERARTTRTWIPSRRSRSRPSR